MELFENTDKFKKYFDLNKEYFAFQSLQDNAVGFLVKRYYPKTLRYHPPIDSNGNPKYVTLLRIEYMSSKGINNKEKIPLDINAYLCPFKGTRISLSRQKNPKEPIDLEFSGYFFDHKTDKIVDDDGKQLSGRELLEYVYKTHCNTACFWKGLRFRWKLKIRKAYLSTLASIINLCRFILETILGRKLRNAKGTLIPTPVEFDLNRMRQEDEKYNLPSETDKEDYLEIFNYKAPKRLIITFSTSMLLGYSIVFFILEQNSILYRYLRSIFTSTFLSAIAGIFLLFMLDSIVPKVVLWILNMGLRAHKNLLFRRTKF